MPLHLVRTRSPSTFREYTPCAPSSEDAAPNLRSASPMTVSMISMDPSSRIPLMMPPVRRRLTMSHSLGPLAWQTSTILARPAFSSTMVKKPWQNISP